MLLTAQTIGALPTSVKAGMAPEWRWLIAFQLGWIIFGRQSFGLRWMAFGLLLTRSFSNLSLLPPNLGDLAGFVCLLIDHQVVLRGQFCDINLVGPSFACCAPTQASEFSSFRPEKHHR
jgi:hypothetical protein